MKMKFNMELSCEIIHAYRSYAKFYANIIKKDVSAHFNKSLAYVTYHIIDFLA